jgi:hypothetical protein
MKKSVESLTVPPSKIFQKTKTTLEDFLPVERKTGDAGRQILLTDASADTERNYQNCKTWRSVGHPKF